MERRLTNQNREIHGEPQRHLKRHHSEQYKSVELKDTELNRNCIISQLVKKKSRLIFLKQAKGLLRQFLMKILKMLVYNEVPLCLLKVMV